MHQGLIDLKAAISISREKLLQHPVYFKMNELSALQQFASIHVFAVWDFMSLLKSLQQNLTCVSIPWVPVGSANTRYLINEIVLGEESDMNEQGERISHFELYLTAMEQMGASTEKIQILIKEIQKGTPIDQAIESLDISENVKAFLSFTFSIVAKSPTHVQAAVFTFGREDLIPDMFMKLLEKWYAKFPEKVSIFKYYIERHIEVDGGHHSHLALEMVSELCGNDPIKWQEATWAAQKALEIRAQLWDAVLEKI